MAVRPTWRGHLKVSLVTIPIKVFPATESSATISFNQLHGECRSRLRQKRWCPTCDREVPQTEVVKGYEFEKGRYVVVTEEDLGKVRTPSTRVIELTQFADGSLLDPIYIDKAYYLAPDGAMAAEAFAVMREGLDQKAGIGKLALYGREYRVAVRARDRGLVMYTLRHAAEVRNVSSIDGFDQIPTDVKGDELKLARQVIGSFAQEVDLTTLVDEYQQQLRAVIDTKIAGEEFVAPEIEAPPKVVNLMEALRKSLDTVSEGKKRPARVPAARRSTAKVARSGGRRKAR